MLKNFWGCAVWYFSIFSIFPYRYHYLFSTKIFYNFHLYKNTAGIHKSSNILYKIKKYIYRKIEIGIFYIRISVAIHRISILIFFLLLVLSKFIPYSYSTVPIRQVIPSLMEIVTISKIFIRLYYTIIVMITTLYEIKNRVLKSILKLITNNFFSFFFIKQICIFLLKKYRLSFLGNSPGSHYLSFFLFY